LDPEDIKILSLGANLAGHGSPELISD